MTISPTQPGYFANHEFADLKWVVDHYTANSVATAVSAPELSAEAMKIANNAWAEMVSRETCDCEKGWFVIESREYGLEIQRCDDCKRLTDEQARALPEAQEALRVALEEAGQ